MRDRRQVLLRFVLLRSHPDTGVEEGVFSAAHDLRDSALTPISDRRLLEGLLSWFEANLATPARFNRTKSKGYYRRRTSGVSWLKPTAVEHITKMRALIVILEENGYRVSQITTKRPGYVVFEDDHQVVAEPFRNARKLPACSSGRLLAIRTKLKRKSAAYRYCSFMFLFSRCILAVLEFHSK